MSNIWRQEKILEGLHGGIYADPITQACLKNEHLLLHHAMNGNSFSESLYLLEHLLEHVARSQRLNFIWPSGLYSYIPVIHPQLPSGHLVFFPVANTLSTSNCSYFQ